MNDSILETLRQPFEPRHISWKPGSLAKDGSKCMALAFADLRAYQERLDEACSVNWSCRYLPWGDNRIICELTIYGVTRSSTGEMDAQDEKNNMGGTVSEAQSFKRACAMWGLGRDLYDLPSVWVGYDPQARKISKEGQAELDRRYREWYAKKTAQPKAKAQPEPSVDGDVLFDKDDKPQEDAGHAGEEQRKELNRLGESFYGAEWQDRRSELALAISKERTGALANLTPQEVSRLIEGIKRRMDEIRKLEAAVAN